MALKSLSKTKTRALAPRKVAGIALKKPKQSVPDEQRFAMIQVAAYYRAQNAGFCGDCAEYWAAAEAEIDRQLGRG